jgi:hypothetical protein
MRAINRITPPSAARLLHIPLPLPSGEGRSEGAAYCLPPAATRRSGISLLEVLICIGVVAIGLVSIAALIPVGGLQVQRANTEERKGTLGLNAFREFQIRGMGTIPTLPYLAGLTPAQILAIQQAVQQQEPWVAADGSPFFSVDASGNWQASTNPPLAIDPLMISVAGSTVDRFPANAPSGAPTLKRLALRSVYSSPPASAAVFTAADDVVTNIPDDTSQIGTSTVDSTGNKHDFNGAFTWLVTLTPNFPPTLESGTSPPATIFMRPPQSSDQYTLSIVVFDRRILTTPVPANIDSGQEEIVQAISATPAANSVSGGEFMLADASGNASAKLSMVRPEQWLMLTRYLPQAFTYNDPVLGPQTVYYPYLEAKWYRIVAVGDITQSGSTYSRQVTLDGADWAADHTAANTASPSASYIAPANVAWGTVPVGFQNYNTYACLFDGAVGVFQKVIHLEGPSNWSQ